MSNLLFLFLRNFFLSFILSSSLVLTSFGQFELDVDNNRLKWGTGNTITGLNSTAWGSGNTITGNVSSVWGLNNFVSMVNSTAWGSQNRILSSRSTVWGNGNVTTGENATVWGLNNKALSFYETVFGYYADTLTHSNAFNYENDDFLLAVGNGSFNNRHNALTIFKSGTTHMKSTSGNMNLYLEGDGASNNGINFGIKTPNSGNAKLYISHFDGSVYKDRIVIDTAGRVTINVLGTPGITFMCRNASNQLALCSSSRRYKESIHAYDKGFAVLDKLQPVTFSWKESGEPDLGLVAEEVAEIEPLLATYNDQKEVEGVKYERIGIILVNAVKELKTQNDLLMEKNEKLIELISDLQTRVSQLENLE